MLLQVLIVDDAATDRIAFRRHLTRGTPNPCQIAEVASAAEALRYLEEARPHCILLDADLPDCDGVTLVSRMVERHGANAFGIVMLTSETTVELAAESLRRGAHDFLQKSAVGAISLRRAVDNAVEKAAIQRKSEEQRTALAEKNRLLEEHVARLEREVEERRRAEELLRESEQQLRLVADHAAVLMVHCDQYARYKFVNRSYAERFGLTPPQIVGRHVAEVLGTDAFDAIEDRIRAALSGQRVEYEVEIPYAALGRRWMHVVYAPEVSADGVVSGFVGVMTDTTERKTAERDLEAARDEALAASKAKDDFLAALSHELRTPLNPVLLLASEAAEDPEVPAHLREIFDTIRKNVDLEARLIDDLLYITRISRGKLVYERWSLNLHDILRDALSNVAAEAAQKHLSLRTHLNAPFRTVMGDAVRLQQVFWNVLKNAVKFTPEGGSITISTHSLPETDQIEVMVQDTGIGMTQEELARVFDPFSQGNHAENGGAHRFGGLGLGLAISRMLIESHSGHISAKSAGPGEGSLFTIRLPLAPQVPGAAVTLPLSPDMEEADTVQREKAVPISAAAVRILLVEDNDATRASLATLLQRRGFPVVQAASVAEAISAADLGDFELLISDIGLPDGSGHDLMTALAARCPRLRGIALTGYGMERDVDRSTAAGFSVHLTKPISMQALEGAIRRTFAMAVG